MNIKKLAKTFGNPLWRVQNLYTIVNKAGDQVKFRPNAPQEMLNEFTSKRRMVLKARQMGVSTNEILRMFDATCFNRNTTHVIIAHEQGGIEKLFRICKRAYKYMPENIKPRLDRGGGSKYEMYFPEINSRIYCDLEVRGDTVQWLHVSEMAFMKDSSRVKSTLQAVPIRTGRVTIETTPNGMANHFYDMWIDREQPYKKIFFPWFIFNEYQLPAGKMTRTDEEKKFAKQAFKEYGITITDNQIAFRRIKKAELKPSAHDKKRVTFEQEYPEDDITCFLVSGEAVMDLKKVQALIDACEGPIFDDEEGFKQYKNYNKNRTYVCGGDPAEGIGKDWSVGVIIEIETLTVVAVCRGQWKPSEFARKLNEMCRIYSRNNSDCPILVVERNNHGHAVIQALHEGLKAHGNLPEMAAYPNIWVCPTDERLGWKTDNITRPVMFSNFVDAAEDGYLKIYDLDTLTECLTLVDNKGRIEAAEGKHDDCIASTAIALQVALQNSPQLYANIDKRILL